MLVHVAVAALLTGLGVWLGIPIADLPIATGNVLAMTLHLALLGTAAGALALLLSVVLGRWKLGLLLAAVVAFVAYVVASFLPLSESLEGLAVPVALVPLQRLGPARQRARPALPARPRRPDGAPALGQRRGPSIGATCPVETRAMRALRPARGGDGMAHSGR